MTIPGYECSANTGLGGDYNVYFHHENETIHRSSHALVADLSDADTDCHSAWELFKTLRHRDAFIYAHVGGRYAWSSPIYVTRDLVTRSTRRRIE